MENEALAGEVPAPDAVTPEVTQAESSPAPETTEKVTADASAEATEIPKLQKRFDKLTWERGEANRRAEAAERRAWELEQQMRQPKEAPKGPPTLAQFEYDEAKHQAASVEYYRSVAREEALEALKAERQSEQQQTAIQSFRQREAEFSAKTPDYKEKVYGTEFLSIPLSTEVATLIAKSPDGPGIAYYLSENLPLASEIARMPPMEAAVEIGKIQSQLSQPKTAPVVSKAPAPPPKIDAVEPDVKKDISDPTISDAEFARIRLRQKAQRR